VTVVVPAFQDRIAVGVATLLSADTATLLVETGSWIALFGSRPARRQLEELGARYAGRVSAKQAPSHGELFRIPEAGLGR
jgi:allophanate hydrolase